MKFSVQNPKKSLHLVSLGCTTKSCMIQEIMLGKLKDYTITNDAANADVIIVNTCGFIDSAKQESLNTILNLSRWEEKRVSFSNGWMFKWKIPRWTSKELPEIDVFTGVGDYDKIDLLVNEKRCIYKWSILASWWQMKE